MNRRQFFTQLGRNTLLGILAATIGVLLYNKQIDFEQCNQHFNCKKCKDTDKCNLPEKQLVEKNTNPIKTL